jgi:hypothetical protein
MRKHLIAYIRLADGCQGLGRSVKTSGLDIRHYVGASALREMSKGRSQEPARLPMALAAKLIASASSVTLKMKESRP